MLHVFPFFVSCSFLVRFCVYVCFLFRWRGGTNRRGGGVKRVQNENEKIKKKNGSDGRRAAVSCATRRPKKKKKKEEEANEQSKGLMLSIRCGTAQEAEPSREEEPWG